MAHVLERKLKTIVRHFLCAVVYPRIHNKIFEKCVFENGRPEIVDVYFEKSLYKFMIADKNDLVQSIHSSGNLYEEEELNIIKNHYEKDSTFVDVGANVGNHSIFALIDLKSHRVIAFEPCLIQHTLLSINFLLNGAAEKTEIHKIALSDIAGSTWIYGIKENIASANLRPLPSGELVRLARGDTILNDIGPFFLKIDVEGHEMKVLDGLKKNIDKHRPKIFMEVSNHNVELFDSWVRNNRYHIAQRFKRYETNENFMLLPNS